MGKLLQASALLKEKGYIENKFDTNGFTELVYNWFRQHDLKDKLLIKPKRFVEMQNPPVCGYIDMTDTDEWEKNLPWEERQDRKSTRLNSSHANISYAVFCLKKKHNL